MSVRMETSDSQLHELQRLVNVAREGSKTITVPKEALRRLLLDHHTLYQALRDRRLLQISPGPDQGSLL